MLSYDNTLGENRHNEEGTFIRGAGDERPISICKEIFLILKYKSLNAFHGKQIRIAKDARPLALYGI